jgi:hypothetical protein
VRMRVRNAIGIVRRIIFDVDMRMFAMTMIWVNLTGRLMSVCETSPNSSDLLSLFAMCSKCCDVKDCATGYR